MEVSHIVETEGCWMVVVVVAAPSVAAIVAVKTPVVAAAAAAAAACCCWECLESGQIRERLERRRQQSLQMYHRAEKQLRIVAMAWFVPFRFLWFVRSSSMVFVGEGKLKANLNFSARRDLS